MTRRRTFRSRASIERLCSILTGAAPPTAEQFQALESLASRHGVRALLRNALLSARPDNASNDDFQSLADLALREAALEARRNHMVRTALDALAWAGVPALVFKGTALAHSHYPRPELRERDDTDIAVDRSHLDTAAAIFERLGFAAMTANQGSLIMRQRLYRKRDADGVLHNIDLHWAISNSARTDGLRVRDLLARSVALTALGTHARMPEPTDALLIACAHLDAHHVHEVRMIWLYDLHLLIGRMSPGQRHVAVQRAAACHLVPACAWVLATLEDTLRSSLSGFDVLRAHAGIEPPPAGRAAQWWRELANMNNNRTRFAWLWQHLVPDARYLRAIGHVNAPLWRMYLARARRGIAHLAR